MQTIQRNEYDPICLGLPIPRRVNEISFDDYGFAVTSPLPVREGDCLCFGPCHTSQEWFLAPYGEDGEGVLSPVGFSDAVVHDSIGDEEKILCWTVPSGVFQIRFATLGRYEKHAVLTRNAPFGRTAYEEYISRLEAENYGYGKPNPKSPLFGKRALFIGDSITAGSYDLRSPKEGRSWAGRLAASTGLLITNAGAGGESMAYNPDDPRWIFDEYLAHKDEQYDMVVMHGGVNDARRNLAVGEGMDSDDEELIRSNITTFAGGLQWLFHHVTKNWKNAKLFYISNFRLNGCPTGRARDMDDYVVQMKPLCDKYGITYVDLYGNEELTRRLAPTEVTYLPDLLHPCTKGYDVIQPYVQGVIEDAM